MPYVLSANRAAISPTLERLARALDLAEPSYDGVLAWIMELRRRLQIPPTLEALGVREEHVEVLATRAAADPSAATNPLPLEAPAYAALLRRGRIGQLSA